MNIKPKKFSISLFLLLHILIFCGCGAGKKGKAREKKSPIGSVLSLNSTLDTNSSKIANRICDALRFYRSYIFENNLIGQSFDLNLKAKHCKAVLEQYTQRVTLISGAGGNSLFFNSNSSQFYFRKVESHIDGELQYLCPQILRGESVTLVEAVDLKNIKQIEFYQEAGEDKYRIIKATSTKNNDGSASAEYIIQEATQYSLYTSQNGILGKIREIRRDTTCSDPLDKSFFIQSY